jgi:hypothetical protein
MPVFCEFLSQDAGFFILWRCSFAGAFSAIFNLADYIVWVLLRCNAVALFVFLSAPAWAGIVSANFGTRADRLGRFSLRG